MKSLYDILAVLLSGSILIFSFFYIVNFQAKLFSDLFEHKNNNDELKKELEKLKQERLALEKENDEIEARIHNIKNKYNKPYK